MSEDIRRVFQSMPEGTDWTVEGPNGEIVASGVKGAGDSSVVTWLLGILALLGVTFIVFKYGGRFVAQVKLPVPPPPTPQPLPVVFKLQFLDPSGWKQYNGDYPTLDRAQADANSQILGYSTLWRILDGTGASVAGGKTEPAPLPTCPPGQHWDPVQLKCVPDIVPVSLTYRLEAPTGTVIVSNTTLAACQAAIANLPPSTMWEIRDSDNTLISSGTTPGGGGGGGGGGVTGPFGPEWYYQPYGGASGSGSVQSTNGVLQTSQDTPGGDDNNYGFATAQRGTFPWGSTKGDPLPSGLTRIDTKATNIQEFYYSGHSRSHFYVAIYYKLNATRTARGATHNWLDTQVRVVTVDGQQQAGGTEETYDAGDSFGRGLTVTRPDFSLDVNQIFRDACAAWGIDPSVGYDIAASGIEIGTEGFHARISADWPGYELITTLVPTCPPGQHWDAAQQKCVPDIILPPTCPPGQHWDPVQQKCVPDIILPGAIDQIVMILMENHGFSDIYGPAPYLTQLADQNGLATNWIAITNPSQPNYVAIAFGDLMGVSGDGNNPSLPPPTLLDQVRAVGKTFRVIQNGSRGSDHNGFLLESPDISNTMSGDSGDVIAAAQAGVNFIWFTPSDNQNMHDNDVPSGDSWLQSWIPQLLTAMSGRKSLLIITWDEDGGGSTPIYTAFIGNAAKKGYKSSTFHNHYAWGKFLTTIWGAPSLGRQDVSATAPTEFLV